jgi:ABC-type uncharacterized transport system substrate-binding protein
VDIFRSSASYVDLILRGAKPADLPVQLPVKFEMAVNVRTAMALGLSVPPTLLALATLGGGAPDTDCRRRSYPVPAGRLCVF